VKGPRQPPGSAAGSGPAFVALILAGLLAGLLALFPISCLDVWWHLKTGEYILAEQSIPARDIFTYTAWGRTWITHEWLAGVIFFLLHRLGGDNLLVVGKAVLAALTVAVGAGAALVGPRSRERLAAVAVGALVAAPLLAQRAYVRPHLLTAALLAVTLLLLRLEATTGRRVWRLALLPVFLLWANLHSGFVLGLGLIVCYWVGEEIGRRTGLSTPSREAGWRGRLGTLGLVILVALVNPHHVEAFLYPVKLVARSEVTDAIVELRHVFHPAYEGAFFLKALAAVAVLLGVSLAGARRRLDPALFLPGLLFAALALKSVRGVTEFAVLVPALIGVHGQWLGKYRLGGRVVAVAVCCLALAGGAAACRWGMPMGSGTFRPIGLGVVQEKYPAAAVSFLQQTRPAGNLFNVLGFGGYFIQELWPERKIFIDGRLDIYPEGFLDSYGALLRTGAGWDEICRDFDITLAVVDYDPVPGRNAGLRVRLREDPDWVCVFFGENVLVYARREPRNEEILARFGCPVDPSTRALEPILTFAASAPADELAQAVSAMEAMHALAPRDKTILVTLGLVLDGSGRSAEGATRLGQAVELGPESASARVLLAGALARSGAGAEARRELERVLAAEPENVGALIVLADLERKEKDVTGALGHLEQAVRCDPGNYLVHLRLGELYAEQGNLEQARRHLQRAVASRPGDSVARRKLQDLRGRGP